MEPTPPAVETQWGLKHWAAREVPQPAADPLLAWGFTFSSLSGDTSAQLRPRLRCDVTATCFSPPTPSSLRPRTSICPKAAGSGRGGRLRGWPLGPGLGLCGSRGHWAEALLAGDGQAAAGLVGLQPAVCDGSLALLGKVNGQIAAGARPKAETFLGIDLFSRAPHLCAMKPGNSKSIREAA